MKEINLSKGKVAIVDDEDFEYLNQWKWYMQHEYPARNTTVSEGLPRKTIKMHNAIMNPPNGVRVDHIDLNKLNNQRSNLRLCTHAENMRNKAKQRNSRYSKYKGVSIGFSRGKYPYYRCKITKCKKEVIKTFPYTSEGEIQAAKFYNEVAKQLFGNFARLNEI